MSFLHPQARDTGPASQGETADAPLTWRLDQWAESQQRWWHEWLEAGQLWSSWWLSQLPPFGWPPIGSVLPPEPIAPMRTAGPRETDPDLQAAEQAPARPSRARAARHT